MEIKPFQYDLSAKHLDILETVDCLVAFGFPWSHSSTSPHSSRIFDFIYKHRATLKKLSIKYADVEFRNRWLQSLDEFPGASCNFSLVSEDIRGEDIPLYYNKLASGVVNFRMNHVLDSVLETDMFLEYLKKPIRPTQSGSIKVRFNNEFCNGAIKPLLQHSHFTDISLRFYYADEDHGRTVPLDFQLADNIQRLSMRFDNLAFKAFYAPNLKYLDIYLNCEPNHDLVDLLFDELSSIIGDQVPSLLRLSITTDDYVETPYSGSFIEFLASVSRHPTLEMLQVPNFNDPGLLAQAILNSRTIVKVTIDRIGNNQKYTKPRCV
eukprot:gene17018-20264_t